MVDPLFVIREYEYSESLLETWSQIRMKSFGKKSINISLAVFSGLLLFYSFPKFGTGFIAWVALIPFFFALRERNPLGGFKIGFLAGFVAHAGILYWIAYVVVQYGYQPLYIGIMVMLLLAAYLSLYTACFAAGVVFLRERGVPLFLSAPLLWTIIEYGRSHLLTGFPWENLAYSQYLQYNIIQVADITGIYGISFMIVMANAIFFNLLSGDLSRSHAVKQLAALCLLMLTIYGYGHYRTGEIEASLKAAPRQEVALIQGNIDQNIKWNPGYQRDTIDIYRSLSLEAAPSEKGLIVWPETAAPFYFQRNDTMRDAVVSVAKASGAHLLFGSPSYEDAGGVQHYMNSAYVLRPDGTINGRYDKVHLVPYGEYVPLRQLFPFIGKLVAGVGDFRAGNGSHPIILDGHRLGVLICYEGIFPELSITYKKNNADLLVNITNDAWFGRTSAPYQHLSMTVFRAIENRLYLVRAANTGISALIDPIGKIVSQTELFKRTALRGEVKFLDQQTFYAAHGDIFVFACGICLLITLFISKKRRRNSHD